MSDTFAIATSVLALAVSIVTAWLTFFYRGSVRITAPSMVVLSYDARGSRDGFDPKIMVRCLIFSTGERGRVIETLFARLRNDASDELFPVWGMDADSKLVRGGGLWVGKIGVAAWQHFVANTDFQFQPGTYTLEVFARVHGSNRPRKLWSTVLSLPQACAPSRHDGRDQVWFDREPQSGQLQPRLESRGAVSPRPANS
jgi:hypothetical protein